MTNAAVLIPSAMIPIGLLVYGFTAWRFYGVYEATGPLVSGVLCLVIWALLASTLL